MAIFRVDDLFTGDALIFESAARSAPSDPTLSARSVAAAPQFSPPQPSPPQPSVSLPQRSIITRLSSRISDAEVMCFQRFIMQLSGLQLAVKVNDNDSAVLSYRPSRGTAAPDTLNVHFMFLAAPEPVQRALAQFVKRPTPKSNRIVRDYMELGLAEVDRLRRSGPEQSDDAPPVVGLSEKAAAEWRARLARMITARPPRQVALMSRGRVYDLHAMAQEVNEQFFQGKVQVSITYGRMGTARRSTRRNIIFGSYHARQRLIRIHPALDSTEVPEYFVRFVIYHEMLHAVLDPEHDARGRRCVHTTEFRRREKLHPDYKKSMDWEQHFTKL